jgi:hypothetical protein
MLDAILQKDVEDARSRESIRLSLVVPVFNESETVPYS